MIGTFAGHQAVKVLVRRRKRRTSLPDAREPEIQTNAASGSGSGASTPQSMAPSAQVSPGIKPTTPVIYSQNPSTNGSPMTQPQTPNLYPTLSISSSIVSIEPLSQGHRTPGTIGESLNMSSTSITPNGQLIANSNRSSLSGVPRRFDSGSTADSATLESLTNSVSSLRFPSSARVYDMNEWEDVEIGKGLALYNSMEIDRLRGCKR